MTPSRGRSASRPTARRRPLQARGRLLAALGALGAAALACGAGQRAEAQEPYATLRASGAAIARDLADCLT